MKMRTRIRQFCLISGDALLSFIVIYAISKMGDGSLAAINFAALPDTIGNIFIVLLLLFSSFVLHLYDSEKAFSLSPKRLLVMIPLSLMISMVILLILKNLLPGAAMENTSMLFTFAVFGVFQFSWHVASKSIVSSLGKAKRVLIIGTGDLAKKIGEIVYMSNHGYVLAGYYNLTRSNGEGADADEKIDTLPDMLRKKGIDKLVVSFTERRGIFPLRELLNCKFAGIEIVDAQTFYEELMGKLLVENTTPGWFIFSDGFKLNTSRRIYGRARDIFLALVGLSVTLPFLPLAALLIKMDSTGPIFFKQVRVGKGEKPFLLYKFRTMKNGAESETGAVWADQNDGRVTRVGRYLRKARIDEFPQFYNVLKGDMSFIGPRPERPEFVKGLKAIIPYYSERHSVRPGITGWAQIKYPYGASEKDALEKLRYDLFYIKNMSVLLDCRIILETIKVVLFRKGAR